MHDFDYCQTLDSKPNHSHRVLRGLLFSKGLNFNYLTVCFTHFRLFFPKSLFSFADLFAVRYLWVVCNEDKRCAVTQRAGRHLRRLACLMGLFTFARLACLLQL